MLQTFSIILPGEHASFFKKKTCILIVVGDELLLWFQSETCGEKGPAAVFHTTFDKKLVFAQGALLFYYTAIQRVIRAYLK